ncbi:MAG TPA: A24 family peptidase [Steroidobacteraceae bacterium]|nr:A24 family peptidase [Steroidobacteraceae bacterium]
MATTRLILAASVLTFVTVLAITDCRTHRIPNRLTLPAAITALLINIGIAGLAGAWRSGMGLVVGLAVFLPFFLAGKFGAGDVKGMAAVGSFVGPYGVVLAACWTLIAGMVAGLALLVVMGGWPAVRSMFGSWIGRVSGGEVPRGGLARLRFPYGFAIAFGTAIAVMLTTVP